MLKPESFSAVRKPLAQAETLPSLCYTDPDFFEYEKKAIFQPTWHFVGRVDELSKTGDITLLDTIVGSVIICRGKELKAFINACRHRGTRLKNSKANCKTLVCPYHSWVYSLDGKLRTARDMPDNGFCKDDYSLQSVRLETWGGFIFVNFDDSAPALLEWLGDLPHRMAAYKPKELRVAKLIQFDVAANWKFLIENALEAYHTGTVHRMTLGAQESESVQTDGNWNALYVLNDSEKSIATLPDARQALPFIQGLDHKSMRGTWFTVIYPSTQLVFAQDCVWWLDIKPISVDQSKVSLGGCFPESSIGLEAFSELVKPYCDRWKRATEEDNRIAEAQQQGHQSGLKLSGRFAAEEHCVHALDNWVLDRLFTHPL
ncbi:MAG: choline monooxygenase [Parasphingorhabdus sp.]|jgi:choline monooxygenase